MFSIQIMLLGIYDEVCIETLKELGTVSLLSGRDVEYGECWITDLTSSASVEALQLC